MRSLRQFVLAVGLLCLGIRVAVTVQADDTGETTGPYRITAEIDGDRRVFQAKDGISVSAKLWNASGFGLPCDFPFVPLNFYTVHLYLPHREGDRTPRPARLTSLGFDYQRLRANIHSLPRRDPPCLMPPDTFLRPISIDLAKHYDLQEKGVYRVLFSRELRNPMNRAEWINFRSKELTFTLE